MTDEEVKQKAELHWKWLEPLLQFPLSRVQTHYLYVSVAVHFAKHEREVAGLTPTSRRRREWKLKIQ